MSCCYNKLSCNRDSFCDFTIYRDCHVWADQRTNNTPRASIFERVRGVVAFRGKPAHVQLHHLLWTCTDAKFTTFTVSIADFNPTFCRHYHSLSEKFDWISSIYFRPHYHYLQIESIVP